MMDEGAANAGAKGLAAGGDAGGGGMAGVGDAMAERVRAKDRLLERAFVHAAFDGWTRRTLLHAAEDAGMTEADALRLFPRGGDSLALWIDDWADRRMLEACSAEELGRMGVRNKVAALIRARLEALEPHREAVRRAILARTMPRNGLATLEGLQRTTDRIWDAAGFKAEQGPSRYTRRLTLGGVLSVTALFWLQDKTPDLRDTWAFLDRRLDDALRLGRLASPLHSLGRRFPRFERRTS